MRTKSLFLVIFLSIVAVFYGLYTWVSHTDVKLEDQAFETGVESYIYGYPLVLMNTTKQAAMHQKAEGPSATKINTFAHNRELASPAYTLLTSPNVDVLYSYAWIDLSAGPLFLHIPKTTGRYYIMGMLDAWTNVFSDPGTRTDGSEGDDFVIVGPQWNGKLPDNIATITSSTNMAWIILRIECFGPADYETVHALQNQFTLKSLTSTTPSLPLSLHTVPNAQSPESIVAHMDAKEFFGTLTMLLASTPPAPADAPIIEKLAGINIFPGKSFEKEEIDPAVMKGLTKAVPVAQSKINAAIHFSGRVENGWRFCNTSIGTYGTDYLLRASIASWALGVNLPEDAAYPFTYVDRDGAHLNGANTYTIHFAKDQTPPVNGFWSITMYDANHFLVANPINRYAIQSHNHLQYNADGSLDIIIQSSEPKEKQANWLPSPKGDFNLILRMYWPKPQVLDETWSPPALERAAVK